MTIAHALPLLFAALLCLVACGPAKPGPTAGRVKPEFHVTDLPGVLKSDTVASLNNELEAYQALTGHHVLVYVTASSWSQIQSEWCRSAFNSWGVGRRGYDDGVVLFYFVEDRVVWITVGYGLERAIPDREAARIYHDVVSPSIRAGRPDEGIAQGVAEILRLIDKADAAAKGRP